MSETGRRALRPKGPSREVLAEIGVDSLSKSASGLYFPGAFLFPNIELSLGDMSWEVVILEGAVYHVIPLDDNKEHELMSTCGCRPKVEIGKDGRMLIIHDAHDGRVAVEQAQAIISK